MKGTVEGYAGTGRKALSKNLTQLVRGHDGFCAIGEAREI